MKDHLSTPYKPPVAFQSRLYYHGIWFDVLSAGWGFGFMAESMSVCRARLKSAICDDVDHLDDVKDGAFRFGNVNQAYFMCINKKYLLSWYVPCLQIMVIFHGIGRHGFLRRAMMLWRQSNRTVDSGGKVPQKFQAQLIILFTPNVEWGRRRFEAWSRVKNGSLVTISMARNHWE